MARVLGPCNASLTTLRRLFSLVPLAGKASKGHQGPLLVSVHGGKVQNQTQSPAIAARHGAITRPFCSDNGPFVCGKRLCLLRRHVASWAHSVLMTASK